MTSQDVVLKIQMCTDAVFMQGVQNGIKNSCFLYINLSVRYMGYQVCLLYIGMAELYILEVQILLECV
jgi:hypothetical protein